MPAAERLAADFNVYAPDLPGHGKSSKPPNSLDIPGLARALVEWMDAIGLDRAVLVGHSMGCQIAVDAAFRYPSRIERLTLIGPTVDPTRRSIRELLPRLLAGLASERPSFSLHMIRDYAHMGLRIVPELEAMLSDPVEKKLLELTQPVLLMRGGNDLLVPSRWFKQVAWLTGAGRRVVIPGGGHAVQYSAPDRLVPLLVPFLRQR